MPKEHHVTKYEILSLMPAPAGIQAVFAVDGGGFIYDDVMAFAVAKVTSQAFNEKGAAMSGIKNEPNEVVGLLAPGTDDGDSDYKFAHDMIAEEVGNFRGYRRVTL